MSETTRTQNLYKVTLIWRDKTEVLDGWGNSREAAAADAANSAGYGGGAMRALKGWDAELAGKERKPAL
jgi:hypothetical protein